MKRRRVRHRQPVIRQPDRAMRRSRKDFRSVENHEFSNELANSMKQSHHYPLTSTISPIIEVDNQLL